MALWLDECGGRPAGSWLLSGTKQVYAYRDGGTLVTYDLDLDGDNLPLGLTREEAEIFVVCFVFFGEL